MATNQIPGPGPQRQFLEMRYEFYLRVVVRKHGLNPPEVDIKSLSDEELREMVDLVRDMAHLPPV